MVYIIQIIPPLHHAQYYVGYCEPHHLMSRFKYHKAGRGSKLLKAAVEKGHRLEIIAINPQGTRVDERAIKNRESTPKFVRNITRLEHKNPWILCYSID